VGIGLKDSSVALQMSLGMLGGAVARVEEHRSRRSRPGERRVIAT
jgi:hypothetical protein